MRNAARPLGTILLVLLLSSGARGDVPPAESLYGTKVASLSFRGDAPFDEKVLASLTERRRRRVRPTPSPVQEAASR